LPPEERRAVRNRPIGPGQAQEARDHPGGLPEQRLDQHPDRQAEPDCRIREDRRASWTALTRRVPRHLLVPPDHRSPALAQSSPRHRVRTGWRRDGSTGGPGRRAAAGGFGLARPIRPTAGSRGVNPSRRAFCNNALTRPDQLRTGRDLYPLQPRSDERQRCYDLPLVRCAAGQCPGRHNRYHGHLLEADGTRGAENRTSGRVGRRFHAGAIRHHTDLAPSPSGRFLRAGSGRGRPPPGQSPQPGRRPDLGAVSRAIP
ncbi:hypothetical protein EV657_13721, partial [Rhodovulum visakhapatnamense]